MLETSIRVRVEMASVCFMVWLRCVRGVGNCVENYVENRVKNLRETSGGICAKNYFDTTVIVPFMPASKWPGIRQPYMKVPGLVKVQAICWRPPGLTCAM